MQMERGVARRKHFQPPQNCDWRSVNEITSVTYSTKPCMVDVVFLTPLSVGRTRKKHPTTLDFVAKLSSLASVEMA